VRALHCVSYQDDGDGADGTEADAPVPDPEALLAKLVTSDTATHRHVLLSGFPGPSALADPDAAEVERWLQLREMHLGGTAAAFVGLAGSSHPSTLTAFEPGRLPQWRPPATLPTREALLAQPRSTSPTTQENDRVFAVKMTAARALHAAVMEAMK
jgi:hypothetical protein